MLKQARGQYGSLWQALVFFFRPLIEFPFPITTRQIQLLSMLSNERVTLMQGNGRRNLYINPCLLTVSYAVDQNKDYL